MDQTDCIELRNIGLDNVVVKTRDETRNNGFKGSLVNFISEAKLVSKQDVLIMIICPSKFVQ